MLVLLTFWFSTCSKKKKIMTFMIFLANTTKWNLLGIFKEKCNYWNQNLEGTPFLGLNNHITILPRMKMGFRTELLLRELLLFMNWYQGNINIFNLIVLLKNDKWINTAKISDLKKIEPTLYKASVLLNSSKA